MLAAVVFAVGMVGFNLSDGTISLIDDVPLATMEGGMIMGHLEIIHTDKDGNILSYQQTDNAIMNDGRNCAANALFGPGANTACTDDSPGPYTFIGIGNNTNFAGTNTATTLQAEITATGDGLARSEAVRSVLNLADATGDTLGASQTQIRAVFTYTGSQIGNTIEEAGLFNQSSTVTDSVFAMKNFPSDVAMNNGDILTVNWDISISGTDGIGP